MVFGIVGAVVMFVLLVGLYIWTRRSERDFEIEPRELSDREKHARMVEGSAAANIIGSVSGGNGF